VTLRQAWPSGGRGMGCKAMGIMDLHCCSKCIAGGVSGERGVFRLVRIVGCRLLVCGLAVGGLRLDF